MEYEKCAFSYMEMMYSLETDTNDAGGGRGRDERTGSCEGH